MVDIVDDRAHHRLVAEEDGFTAELVYRINGRRFIVLHTGVPDEIGHRGIAAELAKAAIERIKREGLTLVPWCPYTRSLLRDHPELIEGVAVDWTLPPVAQAESEA